MVASTKVGGCPIVCDFHLSKSRGDRHCPPSNGHPDRIPFTPKFLQINCPPVFLCFFVIFTWNSLRHRFFVCNSHALLGESRGCCTETKQEWPDSGSTLENFFVLFTKLIPRKLFVCIAKKFGVDGIWACRHNLFKKGEGSTTQFYASLTVHMKSPANGKLALVEHTKNMRCASTPPFWCNDLGLFRQF